MRVVEVWLDDEFKEYFYTREPTIRGYPIGDISAQLAFKEQHKCKSFKWFMDNIAYEVYEKFPPPPLNLGWGEVSRIVDTKCSLYLLTSFCVSRIFWNSPLFSWQQNGV